MGFFDNMKDRPILSTDWRSYEITGKIDSDAVWIMFGCMLIGSGEAWFDNVHLSAATGTRSEEIALPNSDFEVDSAGAPPRGWFFSSPGYTAGVTAETSFTGRKSVSVKSAIEKLPAELFAERPTPGERVVRDLPGGVSCRVPLVLFADSAGTFPRVDSTSLGDLKTHMEDDLPGTLSAGSRAVRLGDIVIAWNVFQHFYPYFDVAGCGWEKELSRARRGEPGYRCGGFPRDTPEAGCRTP